jgi:GxxExxY protein
MKDIFQLCDVIRQTSFDIHCFLKHGHLEKVYENGLMHRLTTKGLTVRQQAPLAVHDQDGALLGQYFADLIVNDLIIVEVKACERLVSEHVAQLMGYLRGTRMQHGLLINFGGSKLEVKKYIVNSYEVWGSEENNFDRLGERINS